MFSRFFWGDYEMVSIYFCGRKRALISNEKWLGALAHSRRDRLRLRLAPTICRTSSNLILKKAWEEYQFFIKEADPLQYCKSRLCERGLQSARAQSKVPVCFKIPVVQKCKVSISF